MCRRKHFLLYLASAGIPCILFLITLAVIDAVPFGSNTILISDACGQYLDFLSYWRTVLSGENDLFYTFSKTMGGDMLNLSAYYLLSPFNLLFLPAREETLPLFYTLVVMLKISLCGTVFFHVSGKLLGFRKESLVFSTAYALMAYNILYGWNIMWLDGVLILPLMVLGLHRLMDGGSPWLYCFSLFYALAANFYIGYMLCITAVLFFAAELFLRKCPVQTIPRQLGCFCTGSLIGGFGAAAVWLPTFLSLAGERSQTNAAELVLGRNFSVYGFLPKLLCGAASTKEMAGGTPHVFCGTLVLLLAVVFLLSKKADLRIKTAAAAILLVIFGSFYLQPLNIVWHGFSTNNSFNYRYSFIFSFFLILTAQYLFGKPELISRKALLISGGMLLAVFALAFLQQRGFSHDAGTAVSIAVLVICMLGLSLRPGNRIFMLLICAVSLLELGLNCALSWQELVTYPEMVDSNEYTSFVQQTGAAVDYVKEQDSGFYRMEKTSHRTINDAALFSYNGLSHFSSTEPVFPKQFMRNMGFSTEYDFWAWYGEGSTAEVDSLLGVKYLLSQTDLSGKKDFTLLTETDGIRVYRNDHALPVALLCDPGISMVSMTEGNTYERHNAIWQGLTGMSGEILVSAEWSVSTENLQSCLSEDGHTVYEKKDPSRNACIRYEIPVTQELPLSLYFTAPDFQKADLYINGSFEGIYFDMNRWNMVSAGTYAPGETVTVELRLGDHELRIGDALFYYEDASVLSGMAASLQAGAPELRQLSSSRFEGSFRANSGQLLMFTIPFSEGWQLRIDGEPVSCIRLLDTFLAAEIPAGIHNFTLRYIPKGLFAGCTFTGLSLCMAGIWWFLRRKKHSN